MPKQVRVLQVVSRMQRGGIETWLMHVLRTIDRERFRLDFLVNTTEPCDYDAEVRALGARILPCAPPRHAVAHVRDLWRILRQEGGYDVVHAHGSAAVGVTLRLAAAAGVPVRIAHSHNAPTNERRRARSYLYRVATGAWMRRYMTHGLGVSAMANDYLFGPGWRGDRRCQLLELGVDWAPFREPLDAAALRRELNLPAEALVVGHVGRFDAQKNHEFFLKVAAKLVEREARACFLLVGDGQLRPAIEAMAEALGLRERVVFTGSRADVQRALQAMDVFLFPSHYEGLALSFLEAQAVGLPCVISSAIPPEPRLVEPLVRALSLEQPPEVWAETVLEAAGAARSEQHERAWRIVADSRYSIESSLEKLLPIYGGAMPADGRLVRGHHASTPL
jgi:glycosyltransferase involved in cell wall biosynthesis